MRTKIPDSVRTRVLLANRHACCVCQRIDVQIHHIDGNPSNHEDSNLAVLCVQHHDKATSGPSLTAHLKPPEIKAYKRDWERDCANESVRLARSRTAFFMVDYKNADRIRQLFSQLTQNECLYAYKLLRHQFQEEEAWRKEQGFSVSLEPNTSWNGLTEKLLENVATGTVHPECFRKCKTHPLDPLYPRGFFESGAPAFGYYDVWCQIMTRAILVAKGSYDLGDLMRIKDLSHLSIAGRLVSFSGSLRGHVAFPEEYAETPVSTTTLIVKDQAQSWRAELKLKTHYVYSVTATGSLSKGHSNGLLVMRGIERVRERGRKRVVDFSCTPLITGCGGGGPLEIPRESKAH
jgi:hypothetical protein